MKIRLFYGVLTFLTILIGLISRLNFWPKWVFFYMGDSIWAIMVFFIMSTLLPKASIRKRGLLSIVYAWLTEFSQLYQANWINEIRTTKLGALVLGKGFMWSDLLMYVIGVLIACIITKMLTNKNNELYFLNNQKMN